MRQHLPAALDFPKMWVVSNDWSLPLYTFICYLLKILADFFEARACYKTNFVTLPVTVSVF